MGVGGWAFGGMGGGGVGGWGETIHNSLCKSENIIPHTQIHSVRVNTQGPIHSARVKPDFPKIPTCTIHSLEFLDKLGFTLEE